MRNRTMLLIVIISVVALLAVGGTIGAMAMTNSGFMRNNSFMGNNSNDNGNSNGNGNGMMGGDQQSSADQGTPVMGVTRMNMQNTAYQYTNIQVRMGATVTWTNQDTASQSVTFMNGMMDSGLLSHGQSFSYTFNTPGTYQYYSSAHPSMVATVTVVS